MKLEEKQKAIELRKQGYSIIHIAQTLKVAKSSISLWVRDVPLADSQVKILKHRSNILTMAKLNKEKTILRHNTYKTYGYEKAKSDPNFRVLCGIYWGEGTKVNSSFKIANSDPRMIKFIFYWCCQNGYLDRIKFTITTHSANNIPIEIIKNWWMNQLPQLTNNHWNKITIIDSVKYNCKKVGKLPYGTAYLTINSVELFYNIIGGINYLYESAVRESNSATIGL